MTYIVVEKGRYISDVYGPFPSCRAARIVADRLASKESDGYLAFVVQRMYKRGGIRGVFGTFRGRPR